MLALFKYKCTLTIIFSLNLFTAFAQLPDSTLKKIDEIFTKGLKTNGPGFTVGIVRNDSLIFSKGYGLANLEYAIPNKPETIYHMASVSKQFTAYAILLLEQQGKLSLDDDVRKYLSWFPDLKRKISIRNLVNHSSGIRDHWDLNVISGRRMDDVITQDYLVTLLSRQKDLNFNPGEQYSYSNSNFTMLAEIVKKVSGQSFRKFADSAIFKPLGMTSTHFHDDHTEVVPNRAYSYRPLDNDRYANAVLNYANSGATSLFTNVPDMAKWITNFWRPVSGNATTLSKLVTRAVLNNGTTIPYAAGIGVDVYNGKRIFQHSGGDAGYRTFVAVFPDQKMGFMVFSNLGSANPVEKTNALADLFIIPPATVTKKKIDSSMSFFPDTVVIAKYMGKYISDDGARFSYNLKGQQVYWTSTTASHLLARTQNDTLASIFNPDIRFVFTSKSPNEVIVDQYWPGNHRRLKKYTPPASAELENILKNYAGKYYSPEVEMNFNLAMEGGKLVMENRVSITNKTTLEYLNTDLLSAGNYVLRFKRNSNNEITGFELNTSRTKNLFFTKVAL